MREPDGKFAEHIERARVETLFAIAEFDEMRALARARGEESPAGDSICAGLLMLRAALDAAVSLTCGLAPARPAEDYGLAAPDSSQ
jgi:SpoVK/Ycf46/Vps4 family AAA+-type ATPase